MVSASADFEFALALSSWPTRACAGYRSGGIRRAGVGIGTTDTQFSQEPAVAYDIDDVYYPFLFGSNFERLDLDHVEVLRGL